MESLDSTARTGDEQSVDPSFDISDNSSSEFKSTNDAAASRNKKNSDVTTVARKETVALKRAKLVTFLVFLTVSITGCALTALFVRREEEDDFKDEVRSKTRSVVGR
jgi:hypothetical protein